MKRVAVACRPTLNFEKQVAEMFANSIKAYGDEVILCRRLEVQRLRKDIDAVACWGWRMGMVFREMGLDVFVLERGYVDDRFQWTSIGLNGLNGRATFPVVDDGGERWGRYFAHHMKPWKERADGYALIMGQVPTDTAVRDIVFPTWVHDVHVALRKHAPHLPVRFRPHPRVGGGFCPRGAERSEGSLHDDLAGASMVVTFNSNSGVDAVLAGVPTVTYDEGSMAYPVTTHSVRDEPIRPDRTAWAHALAWKQWLPAELQSGEAWARLRTLI